VAYAHCGVFLKLLHQIISFYSKTSLLSGKCHGSRDISYLGWKEARENDIVNPDVWSSDFAVNHISYGYFYVTVKCHLLPDMLFISPSVRLSLVSTILETFKNFTA